MEYAKIYKPEINTAPEIEELDTRYAAILSESSITDRIHTITEEQNALMAEMFESM